MQIPDKRPSFRFRRKSNAGPCRRSKDAGGRGFALLLVMMVAAILLISLTAALPSVYTEAQREKETELIFRGTQYARAVYLFHKQFHFYPASVSQLLRTNDMSFLRRAYRDPMSRDGKWRFIHATPNGIIVDSKDIAVKPATKPGESSSAQDKSAQGSSNSQSGKNQQPADTTNANSNPFGQGQAVGTLIVGVASTSPRASIRVYNGHTHYDKWEFLGVPGVPGSVVQLPISLPGVVSQPQPETPRPPSQTPETPTENPLLPSQPGAPQGR
jgi:type II secretory pathway pseudopilin PulG